ncbi:hypothetical protein [Porphyromonas gingivalis]|uniref:hypothetical protein n=1 Tax=Porphyromonas gingivalis TaxID=837 RepID=UPI0004E7F1AC|nr:hypothetical protein [Porphyromonas gingivalis]AIJ35724.1 hypothetical protein EG14_06680 [Porphyromonas gingivalis]
MKNSRKYISIQQIRIRQEKLERLRRKSVKKKRQRNIDSNGRKKDKEREINERHSLYGHAKRVLVSARQNLSLLKDSENVLDFIRKIENAIAKNQKEILTLDLRQVTSIDIGSISILLSEINKLTQRNIQAICKLPQDSNCKKMFFESGFSDHMRDLQGGRIHYNKKNKNLMVNRGFDKTSNREIGLAIKDSVKYLTGAEDTFRPLYSIAQEMCANSVEHANQYNKNWLFSVWYKDEDNVCFTMTDIGEGILGTLKRKFSQKIKEQLLIDNKEILKRAFEKKYTSVTKDVNRNKGLPKIKNISDANYINNLIVITNNVLLNFSDSTNSKVLNRKFNGTFYYWELNKACIEIWKNRKFA